MALLTPGYWQSTYWPSGYWIDNYWPEYGVVVWSNVILRGFEAVGGNVVYIKGQIKIT